MLDKEKVNKELKMKRIIGIIRKNKDLPLNEIKRLVKKECPEINIDMLIDIITKKKLLSNKVETKNVNSKFEKEER